MDLRRRRRARNRNDIEAESLQAAGAGVGGGEEEEESVGSSNGDGGSSSSIRSDEQPSADDEEESSVEEAQEEEEDAGDGDGDGGDGVDASESSSDDNDDDDEDEDDEDDEDSWDGDDGDIPEEDQFMDEMLAYSLEDMVDMLELATGGGRIERLRLHLIDYMEHWDDDRLMNYPDWFGRFVARIAHPSFDLRSIELTSVAFRTDDGLRAFDLGRLFREVLPHRPGLESLGFLACHISGEYLRLYTDALLEGALGRTPLNELVLDFDGRGVEPLDPDFVAAMADLIRRNVPIRNLDVICRFPGLSEETCRLLCRGLVHNTNLQELTLVGGVYIAGTVDPAVGPASSIQHFTLHGQLSNEGMASIAQQLKMNANMEVLRFSGGFPGYDGAHFGMLVKTIENYNYTLLGVSERYESRDFAIPDPPRLGPGSKMETYMRRNDRIRHALEAWPDYHVPSTALWPMLFEMVNQLPTLLDRFLRRRNVQALCDATAAAVTSRGSSRKRRGRR